MGLADDGYYSWRDLRGWLGLVRVSASGKVFEYVDKNGEWVRDVGLAVNFVDPGSTTLERIDRSIAEQQAERLGVEL